MWDCGDSEEKLKPLQSLSCTNGFTQPTYNPPHLQIRNFEWSPNITKTEVGVTTASVRHCRNRSSSSQVPHTCSPPTKRCIRICQLLPSQMSTSHHQACLSLFLLSCFFLIYICTHTIYIKKVFCIYTYIYIKPKQYTHPHTMLLSQPPSFPSPTTCSPYEGSLFLCFLLNWNYLFKVSIFTTTTTPFGNWGRSSLPSEAPSHLHTTLVLPPSLTALITRLHWVPPNPLHNQQLNFSLYRTIRLKFIFCVTTVASDTLETEGNLRRADICGCVSVSLTPHQK